MILQPQANFTVVRQIGNHTDAGTYYVRAVIREAYSDALLDTLNLEDKGSLRFKKNWQVPADQSGQGFYISIVTSVYTDAGYTTKSENYADEENTYLVQERVLQRGGGGGGLTARDVRRIFTELIEKVPKPDAPVVNIAAQETVDLSPILDAVRAIKIPEAEKPTDVAAILTPHVEKILTAIEAKGVTPETDLSEVIEAIGGVKQDVHSTTEAAVSAIGRKQQEIADENLSKFEEIVKTVEVSIAPTKGKLESPRKEVQEPQPFDIKSLAL